MELFQELKKLLARHLSDNFPKLDVSRCELVSIYTRGPSHLGLGQLWDLTVDIPEKVRDSDRIVFPYLTDSHGYEDTLKRDWENLERAARKLVEAPVGDKMTRVNYHPPSGLWTCLFTPSYGHTYRSVAVSRFDLERLLLDAQ